MLRMPVRRRARVAPAASVALGALVIGVTSRPSAPGTPLLRTSFEPGAERYLVLPYRLGLATQSHPTS